MKDNMGRKLLKSRKMEIFGDDPSGLCIKSKNFGVPLELEIFEKISTSEIRISLCETRLKM